MQFSQDASQICALLFSLLFVYSGSDFFTSYLSFHFSEPLAVYPAGISSGRRPEQRHGGFSIDQRHGGFGIDQRHGGFGMDQRHGGFGMDQRHGGVGMDQRHGGVGMDQRHGDVSMDQCGEGLAQEPLALVEGKLEGLGVSTLVWPSS